MSARQTALSLFALAPFSFLPLLLPLGAFPLSASAIIIALSVLPPSQIAQQQLHYGKDGRTIEPTSTGQEKYYLQIKLGEILLFSEVLRVFHILK